MPARFLPGTRHAQQELLLHLEQDADQYALARRHRPVALASAICKAAESAVPTSSPALSLGGADVVRRVDVLLEAPGCVRLQSAAAAAVAATLLLCSLLAVAALPSAIDAGVSAAATIAPPHLCRA